MRYCSKCFPLSCSQRPQARLSQIPTVSHGRHTIEELRQDFIDNTKAASYNRLALKKYYALLDLVKSVEPELQQT